MRDTPPVAVLPVAILRRPPATDCALLAVAVAAVSTSGPLIVATAVPALAIAFWRNAFATGVMLPWALVRRREIARLGRREWLLAVAGGVSLALHFATWIPSVTLTTVGTSTALVATQPVWAALVATRQGHRLGGEAWAGIGCAVIGAALLTGVDLTVSARAVEGDGLALLGGLFGACYGAFGGAARRSVSTTSYTTICYGTTSVLLLVSCVIGGETLGGYSGISWLRLLALTAGAQLLGHSLFSRTLRRTSSTFVSIVILGEVPGAALLAAIFLHQGVRLSQLPGALALLAGVALLVWSSARALPPPVGDTRG